ncbi:MAG: rRNA maturation RNase YbeY [Cytophagaceae bacterium]|nr:rRNA maturation RNase YbeY [Cytophagaceae bacterium]
MANGRIHFFAEGVDFHVAHPIRLRRWLRCVVEQEGKILNELTYVFCSDEYLHQINVEFLNHDSLTDIITFDTSEGQEGLSGEVYVSLERVSENAYSFNVSFENELARVIVHGILHLCGHQDKLELDKQTMRHLESFYLKSLQFTN